jgi:hypothetical protein
MGLDTEDTLSKFKPRLLSHLWAAPDHYEQCRAQAMAEETRSAARFVQGRVGWAEIIPQATALKCLLDGYHSFLVEQDFTFQAEEVAASRDAFVQELEREKDR